jgi:hypothetical protein
MIPEELAASKKWLYNHLPASPFCGAMRGHNIYLAVFNKL